MTSLRNPAQWLLDLFRNSDSGGDVKVTSETMLGSAAAWFCITSLAGDLAKMPLDVRQSKKDGRGSEPFVKHSAYGLLRDEPNQFQTADVFKEQIQGHALGWGNGRAAIVRVGGRPTELIPLMPDRSDTVLIRGEKYHITIPTEDDPLKFRKIVKESVEQGSILHPDTIVLHDREVLHIQGFGKDGIRGKNIADVARDAIGIDLGSQRYSLNGMRRGFASRLMLEDTLNVFKDDDEAKKFLDKWRQAHANEKDGETVGMLRNGMKATVLNMSNKDSQFLDQRKFSRQEIMLLFRFQHIPGDDSSVSYNSLEQKLLAYLASALDYWLVRWEKQCDCKLRTQLEKRQRRVYHKFNRASWLATDTETTQAVLSGYVQSEIMSKNEAREKLDLNPVEGGDEFKNPAINPTSNGTPPEPDEDVEANLKYLATIERDRVIDAAGKQDYSGWVESFYAKWPFTLIEAGMEISQVKAQAETHKTELLETIQATAGAFSNRDRAVKQLRASVTKVTEGWND